MNDVVAAPTITFSTLAKAMGPTTPAALARMLRGHKYKRSGPRRSYQLARKQAIDLLVDKKPLDPGAGLRLHERDAIQALTRIDLSLPTWVRAERPSTKPALWTLGGVRVSMHPDVDLRGRLESGAVKFSFTKERLGPDVGRSMASLLWYWHARILGEETTLPENCIVYEPRLPWLHRPGQNPGAKIKNAELACKMIAAIWPTI